MMKRLLFFFALFPKYLQRLSVISNKWGECFKYKRNVFKLKIAVRKKKFELISLHSRFEYFQWDVWYIESQSESHAWNNLFLYHRIIIHISSSVAAIKVDLFIIFTRLMSFFIDLLIFYGLRFNLTRSYHYIARILKGKSQDIWCWVKIWNILNISLLPHNSIFAFY